MPSHGEPAVQKVRAAGREKRPPGEGRPERTIRRTRTISLPILFAGEGVDDFEVFDVVVEVGAEG